MAEAKDLKPFSVRLLRCTRSSPGRAIAVRGCEVTEAADSSGEPQPSTKPRRPPRAVAPAARRPRPPGRARRPPRRAVEQLPRRPRRLALRDHGHPAVGQVARLAHQAELERPRPRPPAETHALDESLHPGGEPDGDAGAVRSPSRSLTVPRRYPIGRTGTDRTSRAMARSDRWWPRPRRLRSTGKGVGRCRWWTTRSTSTAAASWRPPSLDTAFERAAHLPDGRPQLRLDRHAAPRTRTRSTPSRTSSACTSWPSRTRSTSTSARSWSATATRRSSVLRPARYVDPVEVIKLGELHLFLGPEFAITVRHADEPDLAVVRKCLEDDPELLRARPVRGAVGRAGQRRRRLRAGAGRAAGRHRPDRGAGLRRRRRGVEADLPADPRGHRLPPGRRAAAATSSRSCGGSSARTATAPTSSCGAGLRDVEDHATRVLERVENFRRC